MSTLGFVAAWSGTDPVAALSDGGVPAATAASYVASQPELTSTALVCGQLGTDFMFRIPTLSWLDAHGPRTWSYDFRWATPLMGLAYHCLELPFTWDVLDAEGVPAVCGDNPPQALADEMHAAWVRFIATGAPGWAAWNGHNAYVLGGEQADTYASSRALAAAL